VVEGLIVTSIQHALGNLFDSLERLEATAGKQDQQRAGRGRKQEQQDLFSGLSTAITVDPAIFARKLDSTIEKIERLLMEG
jgi:hypothetical protein